MNIKRFLELLFKFNFKDFLWLKLIQWEIPQNLQRPHIQNDLGLHFGKSRRCTFRFYQRKHNAVVKVIQGESKTFSFYYHYTFYSFFSIAHPSLVWFLSRVWQRKSICDLRILGSFFSGAWWHKMFTYWILFVDLSPSLPHFLSNSPEGRVSMMSSSINGRDTVHEPMVCKDPPPPLPF